MKMAAEQMKDVKERLNLSFSHVKSSSSAFLSSTTWHTLYTKVSARADPRRKRNAASQKRGLKGATKRLQ